MNNTYINSHLYELDVDLTYVYISTRNKVLINIFSEDCNQKSTILISKNCISTRVKRTDLASNKKSVVGFGRDGQLVGSTPLIKNHKGKYGCQIERL